VKAGISGSASAQYKRFTREVSAEDFRRQNFAQNRRVQALDALPHDLAARVTKICTRDAAAAHEAPPVLQGKSAAAMIEAMKMLPDPALESISEVLHFGKSFTAETQKRTDAHRAQILKVLADSNWDTTEGWKERERLTTAVGAEPPTGKHDVKELVKTGSYFEIALSGSIPTPIGVNITLSGTWSRVRGDANPDNDGNYLNLKLGFDRSMIEHTIVNSALEDAEALAEATEAAENTAAAWANIKDWIINDESSDSVLSSVNQLLTGGSLASMKADKVAIGLLGLGASIEMNLIKGESISGHRLYRLQYVRLTRQSKSSASATIPISATPPISLGIGGERSKSQFIKEFIGTNTLSYVATAYRGIMKHPDGRKEWSDWAIEHRTGLWWLFENIAKEGTNARKEAESIPGLVDECVRQIADIRSKKLEGWTHKWSRFVAMRAVMEQGFDAEAAKRASLKREDLASFHWRGMEESLQRAKITVNLTGSIEVDAVEIAKGWWRMGADWWLVRKAKGYSPAEVAKEFVHQYASIGDLYYSGVSLKLKLVLPGNRIIRVVVKAPENVEDAIAKAFYDEFTDKPSGWRTFPDNVAPPLRFTQVRNRALTIEEAVPQRSAWGVWKQDLREQVIPGLWAALVAKEELEDKVREES
jgi:hypothetical protein